MPLRFTVRTSASTARPSSPTSHKEEPVPSGVGLATGVVQSPRRLLRRAATGEISNSKFLEQPGDRWGGRASGIFFPIAIVRGCDLKLFGSGSLTLHEPQDRRIMRSTVATVRPGTDGNGAQGGAIITTASLRLH